MFQVILRRIGTDSCIRMDPGDAPVLMEVANDSASQSDLWAIRGVSDADDERADAWS